MSSRTSYAYAVLLLLVAVIMRFASLTTLPPGLHNDEIIDLRIAESIRQGNVSVYYGLNGVAREGLYHALLAGETSILGGGSIIYRSFSIWIGLLTLALVYAVGKRLFGPLAGLAAMGLLAVNMTAILFSRTVGREPLVMAVITGVLLASALAFPVYGRRLRGTLDGDTGSYTLLGALLGFGLYLHPIGMMVVLASMAFITYMVITQRPLSRRRRSYIFFALIVLLIIAMPYVTSSIRQPELGGPGRLLGDIDSLPRALIDGLTAFAFVGDSSPAHNLPGRPLLDLVSGLLALVGGVTAARYWRQPRYGLVLIMVVILLPVTLLAANSPNFAAIASVLPLVALFFGLGTASVINGLQPGARRVGMIGLLALLLFNIGWTARDLFTMWPQNEAMQQVYHQRTGELAYYLDHTVDTVPTVLCDPNLNLEAPPVNLSGAQLITLMMNNQDAPLRLVDCRSGLVFANGGETEQVIFPDATIIENAPPTLQEWLALGEMQDQANLPPNSVMKLNVSQALADTIGRFITTTPVMYSPEVADNSAPTAPPVQFGDNLTFLGYEIENPAIYPPGGVVTVMTYWRVDGVLPKNLLLFTHMLADPGASPAANSDMLSVDPERLESRDVFVQVTHIMVPTSAPEGDYWISVGAYRDEGQNKPRLEVLENGQPHGNRLFLYLVTVSKDA